MKAFIAIVVALVVGYFAWDHFRGPKLDGKEIPESARVTFVPQDSYSSFTDLLDNDEWTLIVFSSPDAPGGPELERKLEVAVRERVKTVHLVIVDAGSTSSKISTNLGLTTLPTAWLFDGVGKKSADMDEILELMGVSR